MKSTEHTTAKERVRLTGAKGTLLWTLYFRALDARSKTPLVADPWAADVLDRIDYSRWKVQIRAGDRFLALLRAKRLDEWVWEYLAEHPDATVLHLGCGLDSRAFRLELSDAVRWFDVDYPEVIELRRRLYPEHPAKADYRMIGSSVTDPAWLDEIPTDRPVLVIAEGLLMYLTENDVRGLMERLVGHFGGAENERRSGGGEMYFDVLSPLVTRASKMFGWGVRDPRVLEGWDSRLKFRDEFVLASGFADIPVPGYRLAFRVMNKFAATRFFMRLLRYRF